MNTPAPNNTPPRPSADHTWSLVDHYIAGKLAPADPALDAALTNSDAANFPAINVSPNQGKLLHLLARLTRSRRILEIGTLGGYSTIWLARALPPGGHLTTIELDPARAALARANIQRAGLADSVTIRVGKALDILSQIQSESPAHPGHPGHPEPFDLVFVDADKRNNPNYFQHALKLTRPGSLIIIDNVVREGAITNAQDPDPDIQGTRQLFDMLATEKRFCAAALQTVGVKGYDGLAMVMVL